MDQAFRSVLPHQALLNRADRHRDAFYGTLRSAFRKRKRYGALFLLLLIFFSGFNFVRSWREAAVTMSLNYEQASKGMTPSLTRFNMYEIKTEPVLRKVIAYAGLEGELTPEDLEKCISVQATHDRSASGESEFISTSYQIRFTNDGTVKNRSAKTMLDLLCKAYREYFMEHYAVNQVSLLRLDNLNVSDEYMIQLELLELKAEAVERYVAQRVKVSGDFQDVSSGLSFSQLQPRIQSFLEFDLINLRSFVLENGICINRYELVTFLDCRQRMQQIDYDKRIAAYNIDNEGIEKYESSMTAVFMIPTLDEDSQYYLSKTKTGIDDMADDASLQLSEAAKVMKNIEYDRYITETMEENRPTPTQRKKAFQRLNELKHILQQISNDLGRVDRAYASYRANNYLDFSDNDVSLKARLDPVNAVIWSLLVLAVLFGLAVVNKLTGKRG